MEYRIVLVALKVIRDNAVYLQVVGKGDLGTGSVVVAVQLMHRAIRSTLDCHRCLFQDFDIFGLSRAEIEEAARDLDVAEDRQVAEDILQEVCNPPNNEHPINVICY